METPTRTFGQDNQTSDDDQDDQIEPREGRTTRTLEKQTAKLPSQVFLWAATGSIASALALRVMGKKSLSIFVGQWAPTFLLLGLYNKIVKVAGSDRMDEPRTLH